MLNDNILKNAKHIHFIGIGGSGMFPIVQLLHARGYHITGSDNNESDTLAQERAMGIQISLHQCADNIKGADLIVYTAAILNDNPELIAAKASGIPTVERAEVLGYISSLYNHCICVSGTHGKTTTTALLTQILLGAGVDPTAVIGGKLPVIGGSARLGDSDCMVCEACEFNDHFLQLSPDVAVILNIDSDHLDYFGTLDNIIRSFRTFAHMATKKVIVNGDDPNAEQAVKDLPRERVITFGWSASNDYFPSEVHTPGGARSAFTLWNGKKNLGVFTLNIPGRHNIMNAIAAIAAALDAGAPLELVREHAEKFHGAGRRFEILGNLRGITIADDYAHHPAELAATLQTAKEMPFNKVWAIFQPFTYSRTKVLMDDFAQALSIADKVVMSEIMGSREKNTEGVYTSQLAEKIPGSVWYPGFEEIAQHVMTHAQSGDLVITLGCGDVYKCAKMMLAM